jgi:hypothetical protein
MSVDDVYNEKNGIWASSYIFANPYWVPNTLIKKYHVRDCDIDLGSYNNNFESGRGISVFGVGWPGEEVDIIIKGNTVRNCSRHCVMVTDIAGTASIENNVLISGTTGDNGYFGPNGIATNQTMGGFFDPLYDSDYAQVSILNNYIEAGPESGGFHFYFGIWANKRDGLIIGGNEIKLKGGISNILVGDHWFRKTSNNGIIIKQNKFTGSGMLTPLNLGSATNGVIMNNDFKESTPVEQYVWCLWAENNIFLGNNTTDSVLAYYFREESFNNTVRGHTGGSASVYDPDGDNFLTGVTPMADAGGAGQQTSQAMQELNERLSNEGVGPPNLP